MFDARNERSGDCYWNPDFIRFPTCLSIFKRIEEIHKLPLDLINGEETLLDFDFLPKNSDQIGKYKKSPRGPNSSAAFRQIHNPGVRRTLLFV
jgi:hypothetical protein